MLSESRGISLRLVPTSNGVGVRVVIRGVELNYDLVKTRLLESRSKSGTNKQITKCGNVNFDWFILPLLLPTPTAWFSLDHKRNVSDRVVSGVGRKRKCSDSSDSDSALMTPLSTPTPCYLHRLGVLVWIRKTI